MAIIFLNRSRTLPGIPPIKHPASTATRYDVRFYRGAIGITQTVRSRQRGGDLRMSFWSFGGETHKLTAFVKTDVGITAFVGHRSFLFPICLRPSTASWRRFAPWDHAQGLDESSREVQIAVWSIPRVRVCGPVFQGILS